MKKKIKSSYLLRRYPVYSSKPENIKYSKLFSDLIESLAITSVSKFSGFRVAGQSKAERIPSSSGQFRAIPIYNKLQAIQTASYIVILLKHPKLFRVVVILHL